MMLRADPGPGRRDASHGSRRILAAAAAAILAAAPAAAQTAPAAQAPEIRRAAVSDTELAAEVDGALFLEVLATESDTSASLAARYCGAEEAAASVREANGGAEPVSGSFYRVPFESLLNDARRLLLAALYPEELPVSPLAFGTDESGPYAVYRLKNGEALYSSVAVRFCGRVDPAEVNELSAKVAKRSGIDDVRRIPAGFPVKIPLEDVLPEFLPAGSPQRVEIESTMAAAAKHKLKSSTSRLTGVHVILDAGHGGDDSGALVEGVAEHEYVYDVMCRLRDLLLKNTSARVTTTIRDKSSGYRPIDGAIHRDRDEYILSDPPYSLRSSGRARTGVNLRWRLANQEMQRLLDQGVPAEKIVFISLHADSLHPALRGTMVYVPGIGFRRGLAPGRTRDDLERAEGFSRALAREVVGDLKRSKVAVHAYLPIRDHVIRSGRSWVPAVLRASRVPHSLLIETANLNNKADRALIMKTEFRQQVATSVAGALIRYYEKDSGPAMASSARRLDPSGSRVK